jgi:hypothetical protein
MLKGIKRKKKLAQKPAVKPYLLLIILKIKKLTLM